VADEIKFKKFSHGDRFLFVDHRGRAARDVQPKRSRDGRSTEVHQRGKISTLRLRRVSERRRSPSGSRLFRQHLSEIVAHKSRTVQRIGCVIDVLHTSWPGTPYC